MTPYEVVMYLEGQYEAQQQRQDDIITLAWLTEAFARTKKLPKLDKLLKQPTKTQKKAKAATGEELVAAAKAHGLKGPWDQEVR